MKVEFKSSFAKDLKRIRDEDLKARVRRIIELVENAQELKDVRDIKKLKGGEHYFRIRVGDYRIGLTVQNDAVTFVRLLPRRDIYRYFP